MLFVMSIGQNTETAFYPSMTLETPLNSGRLGLIVVSGTIQDKTRIAKDEDGNAGVYIGLGAPEKSIGAGITVNLYGVTNKYGQKNNIGDGSINLHINRFLFDEKLLVNVGLDNAISWVGQQQEYISYQRSLHVSGNYLVFFKPDNMNGSFSYLSVTGGVGNGSYRRDNNYTQGKSGSFDPFLSLASPLFKGTNIIAEWNGYDIAAGFSTIPLQKVPFVFTFEVTDIKFGKPRYVAAVSFPFNIKKKASDAAPLRPVGIASVRSVRTI